MEIKITVACHNSPSALQSDVYLPILAGAAVHHDPDSLAMQRDDTGDNISWLNPTYCELTALYWLWKNVTADAKGLVHYRRAFIADYRLKIRLKRMFHSTLGHDFTAMDRLTADDFNNQALRLAGRLPQILTHHDVICAKPGRLKATVEQSFLRIGDFYISLTESTLADLYPDYLRDYHNLLKGHSLHFGNLTIMRTEWFDRYCSFLFGVLETVRRRLADEGYLLDPMRERAFSRCLGYIAELLTHTFIAHGRRCNDFKVAQLPVGFMN